MNKCYYCEVPRRSGDTLEDFIYYLDTHNDNPAELPNTPETIGKFTLENMGKARDYIPALIIEDESGNCVEYYVFLDSETLRHDYYAIPEDNSIIEQFSDYLEENPEIWTRYKSGLLCFSEAVRELADIATNKNRPQWEENKIKELAKRIFARVAIWDREEDQTEDTTAEDVKKDPLAVIEWLLDELETYD